MRSASILLLALAVAGCSLLLGDCKGGFRGPFYLHTYANDKACEEKKTR